jgi:hypothetical protein
MMHRSQICHILNATSEGMVMGQWTVRHESVTLTQRYA